MGNAVEKIRGFFSGIIDFVKDNWQGLALLLVNPFVGGFKLLYDNCESFRNFIDTFLNNLKEGFTKFTANIYSSAHELKEKIMNKFNELKDGAINKFHEMKENVSSKLQELNESAAAKVNELKESAVNKFNELKEKATEEINRLKESAVSKFNELKESASSKITELKNSGIAKFNELKDGATEKVRALSNEAIGQFNSIREKGLDGFEKLKSGALDRFNSMKSGISEKLENVRSFVSSTVDKLKALFNFEWKLPNIKLPHFSISGNFSLNPPSIPHIGVEWYKKAMNAPVIMEKPTAFGINPAGQIMAGGEAGSEVVSGTETLMNMISAAVTDNNSMLFNILNKLYDLLSAYLPEFADMQIVLDTGALVGELSQPMNEELGKIAYMRGRRN